MSTRYSPASFSWASVAAWPLMKQRERPEPSTVLRRMTWPGRRPGRARRATRPARPGIEVEFGRQLRPLGAAAHRRSIAAAADEQLDGIHQHRLAGAGFAGEHGESVAEIDG